MMAWAQGGVGMSHGSQSQWASFPKVPIPQLQPGDLVFFGSSGPSNHHVGIYIGGGTMIEAPHTGAYVRYASIYRPDLVSTGSRP
jgi:peptidoglycan DL-endopeptidase CwlO